MNLNFISKNSVLDRLVRYKSSHEELLVDIQSLLKNKGATPLDKNLIWLHDFLHTDKFLSIFDLFVVAHCSANVKKYDQYFSPFHLAEFIANSVSLDTKCRIFDPACGTGSLLAGFTCQLYGTEIDPVLVKISRLRLDLLNRSYAVIKRDFLKWDKQPQFDLVVLNPPFTHALPFIYKAIDYIQPNGKLIALLPSNLFDGRQYLKFRQWLYFNPKFIVLAIVDLPYSTFSPFTSQKIYAVFLYKQKRKNTRRRPEINFFLSEKSGKDRACNYIYREYKNRLVIDHDLYMAQKWIRNNW